jgi:hypothetical protein
MTVESLSPEAQAVVRAVLAFMSITRQLDGELETLLGVDRRELAATLMRWPAVDDRADESRSAVAINNALNEVVNGLELSADEWRELGATRAQVESAYAEWVTKRGWKSTG